MKLALLLVDDVDENLLALQAALAPLGLDMVVARSGPEALGHLLRREDFAALYDFDEVFVKPFLPTRRPRGASAAEAVGSA